MTDTTSSATLVPEGLTQSPSEMGTFNEEGEYTPRQITSNDVGSFADYIDDSMVTVEDGQLVEGKVVRIDKDEVLLDIGFKSEGVVPARELRLLAAAAGLEVDAVWSVEPGDYARRPPDLDHAELLLVARRPG